MAGLCTAELCMAVEILRFYSCCAIVGIKYCADYDKIILLYYSRVLVDNPK